MWAPLSNDDVIAQYQLVIEANVPKKQLLRVIELLREGPYRDLLAVVTSMDRLSLTTAFQPEEDRYECSHPGILLDISQDENIEIQYYPGGRGPERFRCTASKRLTTPEEAVGFIDLLMIRMVHDAERSVRYFENGA